MIIKVETILQACSQINQDPEEEKLLSSVLISLLLVFLPAKELEIRSSIIGAFGF